jgi:hypothetical protein
MSCDNFESTLSAPPAKVRKLKEDQTVHLASLAKFSSASSSDSALTSHSSVPKIVQESFRSNSSSLTFTNQERSQTSESASDQSNLSTVPRHIRTEIKQMASRNSDPQPSSADDSLLASLPVFEAALIVPHLQARDLATLTTVRTLDTILKFENCDFPVRLNQSTLTKPERTTSVYTKLLGMPQSPYALQRRDSLV